LSSNNAMSKRGPPPIIHVDEDYLNSSSLRGLAEVLVHEGWHRIPIRRWHHDD
jgi:hypothetical protein